MIARSPNAPSRAGRLTRPWPSSSVKRHSTPRDSRASNPGPGTHPTTSAESAGFRIRQPGLMRKRLSATTRNGWRSTSDRRAVMRGSSARTVPAPVRMASLRARHRCTSRRDDSLLIHLLSPLPSAVRPSRLWADLTLTHGRPDSILAKKPTLSSRACACISPTSTLTPA